jgi:hypothetical protein
MLQSLPSIQAFVQEQPFTTVSWLLAIFQKGGDSLENEMEMA